MNQKYSFNETKYLRMIMSEMQRQIEKELMEVSKKYGLKKQLLFSHHGILQCLFCADAPMSLTDIAKQAGMALPNVSVGINLLIEDELVEHVVGMENRRIRYVQLTAFGREVCNDYVTSNIPRICDRVYHGITDEEWIVFKRFCLKVGENIQRDRCE